MPLPPYLTAQRTVGVVLIGLGVAMWITWRLLGLESLVGWLCFSFGWLMAFGGNWIYNRGRRHKAAMEAQPLPPDAHKIVTYLRSFSEDQATSKGISTGLAFGGAAVITEEEQFVMVLSDVGPVIAVGEPGENLPPLGAIRMYFGHAEWQKGVEDLLRRSALVVLRPGSWSPGVRWEVKKALELVPPQRLLIVVTGRTGRQGNRDWELFADWLNLVIPHPISSAYPRKGLYHLGSVRAFICFDEDWRPQLLPISVKVVPILKRSGTKRLIPYYRETLRPVLSAIGAPPATPKTSAAQITALGCMSLIFMFSLFGLATMLF